MPPKLKKNLLLMLTNVGSTSLDSQSIEEEPFLDKAKYAMKMLIEKKIFLQPKDEIGIITMGDETDNADDIENIKLYCEHSLIPNWEMVKYVNNLTAKPYTSNWIEALQVALCFIKREVLDPAFRVFLVIFNNFKEDDESIDQFESDAIINELKSYENLFMVFVGENTEENLNSSSEKLALSIINEQLAQYEQINNFIEARQFHLAPPLTPLPWRCALEWDGISIPCATYVKVSDGVKIGSWQLRAVGNKDDALGELMTGINPTNSVKVTKEKIQYDKHRNEISPNDIINGYKFGGKYIPFSEEDEEAMKYSGSEKGMKIYGFVPQNEVKLEYWSGTGSRIIVPDSNEDPKVFYSLLKAMVDKHYAAIVRKVYAKNNLPRMGVLFPKADDDEIYCLVHIELPFANDVREIPRQPIKSLESKVSKEKLDALDDFIDSMTISEKEHDYLKPGKFPNVCNQYHWNAIAQRALNPDETDVLPVNDYIMKYLEPPSDLRERAAPKLNKLNELFGPCLPTTKESKKKEKTVAKIISDTKLSINDPTKKLSQDNLTVSSDEGFVSVQDIDIGTDDLDEL